MHELHPLPLPRASRGCRARKSGKKKDGRRALSSIFEDGEEARKENKMVGRMVGGEWMEKKKQQILERKKKKKKMMTQEGGNGQGEGRKKKKKNKEYEDPRSQVSMTLSVEHYKYVDGIEEYLQKRVKRFKVAGIPWYVESETAVAALRNSLGRDGRVQLCVTCKKLNCKRKDSQLTRGVMDRIEK